MLALLLGAQTRTDVGPDDHRGCISVGPSGALECHSDTLDIVTAVVPRTMAANHFTGFNNFSRGISLDTSERAPKCQPELRGEFWFVRDDTAGDNVEVCAKARSGQYEWQRIQLAATSTSR